MTTQSQAHINTRIPTELLREIFLNSIEANQMTSGQLASVCRHWRSVVTSIASLWSTIRVGTWTETERVATWLQRAYPKKVIIDPRRDSQHPSEAPMFVALQNTLTSTGQWHELTISSFPPENLASQLDVQVASPMNVLKVLHVAVECMDSPSLSHLLNLVPTGAPLTELRLHPAFASTPFLQAAWFPVLRKLTVLIVNGRDMRGQFELLPTFTQLQIFEANHLLIPFYSPNTNLPLLSTLRKLQLRACSIQWMAGRHFACLEECAILLPRDWVEIQLHEVQFPSCKKLTYQGHPMTTAQHFCVPELRAMGLISHDCNEQRVSRHLRQLCRANGRISQLTILHVTLQCSEQVLIKVLNYLVPLQELVLSISYPSPYCTNFLESLAAKPSTKDWPVLGSWTDHRLEWKKWCSSQTWHANVLPHLKYLGIQCSKGFSRPECLEICPILSLVGWTRVWLTPPMEHLKVWQGRGTTDDIVVDYIATGYYEEHLGAPGKECDTMIVSGMVTQCLAINAFNPPLLQLHSTALFRRLEDLKISCNHPTGSLDHYFGIGIFPCLEQVKRLEIWGGDLLAYVLKPDWPFINTLQLLTLRDSTFSWMLGSTFSALREFVVDGPSYEHKNLFYQVGLQVDLPACTILKLENYSEDRLHLLSCPNVQIFHFDDRARWPAMIGAAPKCLTYFLCGCSHLQELKIHIGEELESEISLVQFVFGDAPEQGVWRDIRSVEVIVWLVDSSRNNENRSFASMVGQQHYEKWWKEFTVTDIAPEPIFIVNASM